MISRDITGSVSNGSEQLFNLLALVSNPKLYEEKIKELQDAVAKNQKYVDAVGHVDEVLRLRKEAADAAKAAKDKADESNRLAAEALRKAQAEASAVVSAARDSANKLNNEAKQAVDKANDLVKKAESRNLDVDVREVRLEKIESELKAKEAALVKALAEAEAAKSAALKAKEEVLAKHKAFLQGL